MSPPSDSQNCPLCLCGGICPDCGSQQFDFSAICWNCGCSLKICSDCKSQKIFQYYNSF